VPLNELCELKTST